MRQNFDDNNMSGREELSLLDLNNRIRKTINNAFPDTCWIRAEMSDVRTNVSSGHCYLEFIEKDSSTGQLIAKARGTIWAKTFRMLKPYFEMETGHVFASGLKVLVKVMVDFHELYGFNLTVLDIDPAYTLGDMTRRRLEIITQLKEEGVFDLNKELPFPVLPQRIAIITSPTAAGYGDFLNQLEHNKAGYIFYTKLFPAIMQGERTEESVITALDQVYHYRDCFDVVVIIRGGGATSDLNSFDSYLLAANCAQFPLPLITGIGHERDDTVVDMVAHTRMKTPTAVAEFLIGEMDEAAEELEELQEDIFSLSVDFIHKSKTYLQLLMTQLPSFASRRLEMSRSELELAGSKLPAMAERFLSVRGTSLIDSGRKLQTSATSLLTQRTSFLENIRFRIENLALTHLVENNRHIQMTEQFVKMSSPEYVLQRGYSLTIKSNKIVKHASELSPGDEFVTRFADGEIQSIVK